MRVSPRFLRLASGRPSTNFCVQTKPSVKRVSVLKWPASIGGNLYGLRSSPIRQRFSSNAYFSFFFFFLFSLLFLFFFLFSRSARTGFSRAIFLSFSPRIVYHIFSSSRDVAQRSLHRRNVYTNNGEEEEEGRGRRKRSWKRFLFFFFFTSPRYYLVAKKTVERFLGWGKRGAGRKRGKDGAWTLKHA